MACADHVADLDSTSRRAGFDSDANVSRLETTSELHAEGLSSLKGGSARRTRIRWSVSKLAEMADRTNRAFNDLSE